MSRQRCAADTCLQTEEPVSSIWLRDFLPPLQLIRVSWRSSQPFPLQFPTREIPRFNSHALAAPGKRFNWSETSSGGKLSTCCPTHYLEYFHFFPSDFCIDSLEVMKQHILTTNMSTVIGSSPSLLRVFSSWNKKKRKTNLSFGERVLISLQSLSLFYVTVMVVHIRRSPKDSNTTDVTTCSSNLLFVRNSQPQESWTNGRQSVR